MASISQVVGIPLKVLMNETGINRMIPVTKRMSLFIKNEDNNICALTFFRLFPRDVTAVFPSDPNSSMSGKHQCASRLTYTEMQICPFKPGDEFPLH